MGHFSLVSETCITRVSNAVAAGQTEVDCTSVDMSGYDSVTFICALGTIDATGVPALTVEQSADNSTFNALVSGVTVAYTATDDNKLAIAEVRQPIDRYVRATITRATADAVVDGVIAIQTAAEEADCSHGATVVGTSYNVSPAEA